MFPRNFNIPHFDLSTHLSTVIFVVFVGLFAIGLILGEARLKKIALSTFAGIVTATSLAPVLNTAIKNLHLANLNNNMVQLVLLILIIILLSIGQIHRSEGRMRMSMRLVVLSLVTSGLVVSNIIVFLPPDTAHRLIDQSNIIAILNASRPYWIAAAAIWLVVVNLWPSQRIRK